jgi:hypothetical protein
MHLQATPANAGCSSSERSPQQNVLHSSTVAAAAAAAARELNHAENTHCTMVFYCNILSSFLQGFLNMLDQNGCKATPQQQLYRTCCQTANIA